VRYRVPTYISLVILGSCLFSTPAQASPAGACSIAQAKADVVAAKKRVARAEARLTEAKRILAATRSYTSCYGASVGRWTRLGRRSGYTWGEFPTLMRVIDRESRGNPAVPNSGGSGALGLMQVMPEWADGSKDWYWDQWSLSAKWDRTNAPATLKHTVRMNWSNWGE